MTTPKSTLYAPLIAVGVTLTNTLTSTVRSHLWTALSLGMLAVGIIFMRRNFGGSYIPTVVAILATMVAFLAWWAIA